MGRIEMKKVKMTQLIKIEIVLFENLRGEMDTKK